MRWILHHQYAKSISTNQIPNWPTSVFLPSLTLPSSPPTLQTMLRLLLLLLLTTISTSFYLPSPSFLPSTSLFSSSPDLSTTVSKCESKITSLLSPTSLKVTGADDDPNGSHIFIECVSEKFEGLNRYEESSLCSVSSLWIRWIRYTSACTFGYASFLWSKLTTPIFRSKRILT